MNEKKRVPASPKTRKFARELGVNINLVLGSQRDGRVVEEDIKKFVKNVGQEKNTPSKNEFKSEFTHSDFGEVEVKDIPRIKKIAAMHLSHAWNTIPHVTNHDEADVTDMENFRNSLKDLHTGEKKKITPLAFITKALVATLKKFPSFNSSIDEIENGKMTLKKYFHIGIAVDTEHGLMVPKIRNVDQKDINRYVDIIKIRVEELNKSLKAIEKVMHQDREQFYVEKIGVLYALNIELKKSREILDRDVVSNIDRLAIIEKVSQNADKIVQELQK